MKVTPIDETVESENALFGEEITGESAEERYTLPKRKKINNEDDCKVIKEKDLRKSVKSKVTEGRGRTDDIVVRTTADMSPYCVKLIGEAAASLDTSFESAFVHISSSIHDKVFADLFPLYDEIRKFLLPAFKMNIEEEDGDLGLRHTHIFKKYDDREPEKVSLMLHSSTYTRIKAHTLIFSINNSDIFELMVYNYFYDMDEKLCSQKVKLICKSRIDYFLEHITDKVNEQRNFTKEELSALNMLSCKVKFLELQGKNVSNEFMNVLFVEKSDKNKRTYKESHSEGIFKKKNGRKHRKEEE